MENIERKYKKLSHIEHILLRPERHLGTIRSVQADTWVYDPSSDKIVVKPAFDYSPALLKQFDEIIINSVDHSKTKEGKHLNEIRVNIQKISGMISVQDNGGIPVVKHPEHNEWIPEMLFGSLFAGSNFNDDDEEFNNKQGGGQNGEGASLVNVFSTYFRVETSDGKNSYSQIFKNNLSERSVPVIKPSRNKGTTISWCPDYQRLGMTCLDENNLMMLYRRVFEVSACNPKIKIFLNGRLINVSRFSQFVSYFGDSVCVEETPDWVVGVGATDNGFVHYSYVNSIATRLGGPHVDYIVDQIVNAVRPDLEKAFKTTLKPAMIKNHLKLFLSANIDNPRFDSQTKECMTTPVSLFGTSYRISNKLVTKAKAIIKAGLTEEIAALRNDKQDAENKRIEDEISKRNVNNIPKYYPATKKGDRSKCVVLLTEGDSASNPILSVRDTVNIGVFTMRGKGLNITKASKTDLLKNAEIQNLCALMGGIKLFHKIDIAKSRYRDVIIATDPDEDGKHIRGLVTNLFCTCWPDFVKSGHLKIFRSPYVRIWVKDQVIEFITQEEYDEWLAKNPGVKHKSKLLKGLGGNSTSDFSKYFDNLEKYCDVIVYDENAMESLDKAFGSNTEVRKEWFADVNIFKADGVE